MLIKTLLDLGILVKRERRKSGLSGQAMAEKADLDQGHISRIEGGKSNVTLKTLIRIAESTGKRLYVYFR